MRKTGELTLGANELRAIGITWAATVLQPVGENQARGIVIWVFADVGEEGIFLGIENNSGRLLRN